MGKNKTIGLTAFIDRYGVTKVANGLKIGVSTVYAWKDKTKIPRPSLAYRLIEISKGQLTFDSIYGDFKTRFIDLDQSRRQKLDDKLKWD